MEAIRLCVLLLLFLREGTFKHKDWAKGVGMQIYVQRYGRGSPQSVYGTLCEIQVFRPVDKLVLKWNQKPDVRETELDRDKGGNG